MARSFNKRTCGQGIGTYRVVVCDVKCDDCLRAVISAEWGTATSKGYAGAEKEAVKKAAKAGWTSQRRSKADRTWYDYCAACTAKRAAEIEARQVKIDAARPVRQGELFS